MNTESKIIPTDDGLASLSAAAFMLTHGGVHASATASVDCYSAHKPTLNEALEADFKRLFTGID